MRPPAPRKPPLELKNLTLLRAYKEAKSRFAHASGFAGGFQPVVETDFAEAGPFFSGETGFAGAGLFFSGAFAGSFALGARFRGRGCDFFTTFGAEKFPRCDFAGLFCAVKLIFAFPWPLGSEGARVITSLVWKTWPEGHRRRLQVRSPRPLESMTLDSLLHSGQVTANFFD